MLKNIAQKTQNTLVKQEDKAAVAPRGSQKQLFEQFSEILDKIATSLNRVQDKQNNQSVSDLSAALSQAASMQVKNQAAPQAVKPIAKEAVRSEGQQAGERPQVAEVVTEQTTKSTESAISSRPQELDKVAAQSDKPADQNQTSPEASSDVVTTDTQDAQALAETAHDLNDIEQIVEGAESVEGTEVKGAAATAVESSEVSVENVEATGEIVEVEQATAVSASPVANESEPAPAPKSVATDANKPAVSPVAATTQADPVTEIAADEQTQATQSFESATQAVVDAAQKLAVHQSEKSAAMEAERVSNEEILAQSTQALLAQLIFSSATKQLTEMSAVQKIVSSGHGVQNSAQIGGNGQMAGSQLTQQNARSQSVAEKNSARELPRAFALRTMERVESALKEVARSKDGKTISLRLDPPSLGSVKIDVTIKDGQLHARFVAETAQVSALLRDQAHDLQQMLRKAGVQAEKITISVASEHQAEFNQQFSSLDQQASQQSRDFSRETGRASTGVAATVGEVTSPTNVQRPMDHWVA